MHVQLWVTIPAQMMPKHSHSPVTRLHPAPRRTTAHLAAVSAHPGQPGLILQKLQRRRDTLKRALPQHPRLIHTPASLKRGVKHGHRLGEREREVGVVASLPLLLRHTRPQLGLALRRRKRLLLAKRVAPLRGTLVSTRPAAKRLTGLRMHELPEHAVHGFPVNHPAQPKRLRAPAPPLTGGLAVVAAAAHVVVDLAETGATRVAGEVARVRTKVGPKHKPSVRVRAAHGYAAAPFIIDNA